MRVARTNRSCFALLLLFSVKFSPRRFSYIGKRKNKENAGKWFKKHNFAVCLHIAFKWNAIRHKETAKEREKRWKQSSTFIVDIVQLKRISIHIYCKIIMFFFREIWKTICPLNDLIISHILASVCLRQCHGEYGNTVVFDLHNWWTSISKWERVFFHLACSAIWLLCACGRILERWLFFNGVP